VFWIYVIGTSGAVLALLLNRLIRIVRDFPTNPTYSTVRLALIVFFMAVVILRRKRAERSGAEGREREVTNESR
jgi:hypothetical protein